MSYQVLARKWRPQQFSEMVGQRHVLKALVNALDNQRLHHAYLFTGTRGVGKTTLARLFAKSLNCEEGVSSTPCGVCGSCIELAENRFVDLIEVDAASRTKVEDTRELLDNVQYAPTRGRYKVYLIDEVHMLSNHSFNALLKTLEEPPPHVKFLLATTDPQKLPVTVLSRCLQFNLKSMTQEMVVEHLREILQRERVSFEDGALLHLGKAAQGSMRDALSLTDQSIAYGQGAVREAEVAEMLGTVDTRQILALVTALCAQDAHALLARVQALAEFSPDWQHMMADVLAVLHQLTILQLAPSYEVPLHADELRALAGSVAAEDLQLYYQLGLQAHKDLEAAPEARQGFEMALLRMLAFTPDFKRVPKTTPAAPAGTAPETPTPEPEPVPENHKQSDERVHRDDLGRGIDSEPLVPDAEAEPASASNPAPPAAAVPVSDPPWEREPEPRTESASPIVTPAVPADRSAIEENSKHEAVADASFTGSGDDQPTGHHLEADAGPTDDSFEHSMLPVDDVATESGPDNASLDTAADDIPVAAESGPAPADVPRAVELLAQLDDRVDQPANAEVTPSKTTGDSAVQFPPDTLKAIDAVTDDIESLPDHWLALIPALELSGVMENLVRHSSVMSLYDGNLTLAVQPDYQQIYQDDYRHRVAEALQTLDLGIAEVQIEFTEPGEETLHERDQRLRREAYKTARSSLEQDVVVQTLIKELGGELLADTVEPVPGAAQ